MVGKACFVGTVAETKVELVTSRLNHIESFAKF